MTTPTTSQSLIEQHFNTEFRNIGRVDQVMLLSEITNKLIRDLGKKIADPDLEYLQKTILSTINRRYPTWKVSDIIHAYESGKIGKYGASYAITVANIEMWLYHHNNAEVFPRIDRERIREQREKQLSTIDMTNNHSDYAEAVSLRLSLYDSIKPRKFRHSAPNADYLEKKKRIAAVPLERLADAIRTNTKQKLIESLNL